jgi:hypothetical protein
VGVSDYCEHYIISNYAYVGFTLIDLFLGYLIMLFQLHRLCGVILYEKVIMNRK